MNFDGVAWIVRGNFGFCDVYSRKFRDMHEFL